MIKSSFLIFFTSLLLSSNIILAQTWVRKNAGYGFWSIEKDYAGNIYAGTTGTARGIFKSTDGGETWTNVYSTGASNYLDIAVDPLNNVYVANSSNGLIISTDGGNSFTTIPPTTFGGNSVNTVACGPNGLVLVGVTTGGVYRSTDYGATFTQTLPGYSIVSLQFDNSVPDLVYAGASSTTLNGFFRSTDGGLTFSSVLNPVNVWEILQKQDGTLLTVTTSTGYPVDKSTDLGLTWTTVGNTPAAIRGACLDLAENIYAAGNGGVYKSTDGGATFTNFNLTFSSNKIISFQNKILVAVSGTTNGGIYVYTDETIPVELTSFSAVVLKDEKAVLLNWTTSTETNNRGFEIHRFTEKKNLWENLGFVTGQGTTNELKSYSFIDQNISTGKYKYRLKQIDYDGKFKYSDEVEVIIDFAPLEFELYQNYPNPFNPSTKIIYSVSKPSKVKLYITNLLGQVVEELVNDFNEIGTYELNYTAENLIAGIYFYTLEVGNKKLSKKMIFLK